MRKRWHRAVLMGWNAAAGGIVYLLRDQFTTNATAPLTSPRTCEPGPGQLTIVDPANQLSISSSILQVAGGSGSAWDRGFYSASGLARTAGRALLVAVTQTAGSAFGPAIWSRSAGIVSPAAPGSADHGIRANIGAAYWAYVNGVNVIQHTFGTDFGIVLRAAGAFYLQKLSGTWNLEWVDNAQNTATLYPEFSNFNGVGTLDDFRVVDFGGEWATAYGIATSRTAITIAGSTGLMTADAIVEHTITAATGVTQELMVRRTDDDNCWIVRMDQTGSTIKLIQKQAAVETERSSAAQTWTNGTQYRIVASCFGNTIETNVANVAKNSYTSASFNNTATGVKVSAAGVDLIAWPRTPTVPNV